MGGPNDSPIFDELAAAALVESVDWDAVAADWQRENPEWDQR